VRRQRHHRQYDSREQLAAPTFMLVLSLRSSVFSWVVFLSVFSVSVSARANGAAKPFQAGRWKYAFYSAFVVQAGGVAFAGLLFVLAAWDVLTRHSAEKKSGSLQCSFRR
jgi:hypothetical protein